ncbi:hypothetical protein [Aurantibacter sp.]
MDIISVKDYQEILTDFIVMNLSGIEKRHLKMYIKNSDLSA